MNYYLDTIVSLSQTLEGRAWKVGLADFCARRFKESNLKSHSAQNFSVRIEGLEECLQVSKRRKRSNLPKKPSHPYVLERSDFFCTQDKLCIVVRVVLLQSTSLNSTRRRRDSLTGLWFTPSSFG